MSEASSHVETWLIARLERTALTAKAITGSTRLWQDLSLAGDDAEELFSAIENRFGTDFSGLPFDRYFPDESEAMYAHWARMLRIGRPRPAITVQHLVKVTVSGRWFEPCG